MKRILAMILLLLMISLSAAAEGFVDVAQEYKKILDRYSMAIRPENLEMDAIEEFKKLVAIYEDSTESKSLLDSYLDAKRYYDYARGRIAFYEERYLDALSYFQYLNGFGENTEHYLNYAWGTCYRQYGGDSLATAIEYFRKAAELGKLNSKALGQIEGCRAEYRVWLLNTGDQLRDSGKMEEALQYYQILRDFPDPEGALRYMECSQLIQKGQVLNGVNVTLAEAITADTVQLQWEGPVGDYLVEWYYAGTENLCGSQLVSAANTDIIGLYPATAYRFKIIYTGDSDSFAEIELVTPQLEKWAADNEGEKAYLSFYRYDTAQFELYTKDGLTPYGHFLRNCEPWRTALEFNLNMKEYSPLENGYMLAVSFLEKKPQEYIIPEGNVRILLHVEGQGVFEGIYTAVERSMSVENYIFCLISPLLQQIPAEAQEAAYRLDVIIDGFYVTSCEGML